MGKAFELITVEALGPGAGAAFAAVSGNSLTIRDSQAPIWFVTAWSKRIAGGFIRYTSPLLHDAVVGMQFGCQTGALAVTVPIALQYEGAHQRLYAQDTIVAFGSGSGVGTNIEQSSFIVGYEDLPGVDGYFIDVDELNKRADDVYSFPNTLALGTTGGYSGSEVVNAEVDQLKANTDYAIIGYGVTVPFTSIRYVGQDWGNLGVGGPGSQDAFLTQEWFMRLSMKSGLPAIPVFNSSNKSSTFVSGATDEAGTDGTVNTIAVRLAPRNSKRQ